MKLLAALPLLASCIVGDDPSHPPLTSTVAQPIRWSVSRHVWPTDTHDALTSDLAQIAALGAAYVRTDVWWYAVEPTRGQFDTNALAAYRWYVDEAQRHGLGVIAICSNAPDWAKQLPRAELAAELGAYAEHVAAALGDGVASYQLWNEPNNVTDFADGDTDIALFVAGRAGLERGAGHRVRTAINVLVDGHDGPFGHWEDDVRYYLDHGARDAIDVIAIDHYPATWSIGDWGGNILDRLFALGDAAGKSVAIYETGYATAPCALPFHTEDAQVAWIHDQLPRLRSKLAHHPIELVNWFKLDDRNSGNCFDPEDNFGVLRTDRTRKPAFAALAAEMQQ